MRGFFIPPYEPGNLAAEETLESVIRFSEEQTGWTVNRAKRIRRIAYTHNGRLHEAEVGRPDPLIREDVLVILDAGVYLVCTANRGVLRGQPVLVGREQAMEFAA